MAFSAAGKLLYQRASKKRRASAGTGYLVAICCVSFATSVAAEPSALSGDAIKAAVTGAVVEVDTPLGTKVPIRYFENGRITGEARGLAYILGSPSDSGKWWVSGDRLCHKWAKWFDGALQCLRISQKGSRIFWRRDDGETGTAAISKPPTPPRLVTTLPKSSEPPKIREVPEADGPATSLTATTSSPRPSVQETARADSAPMMGAMNVGALVKSAPAAAKKIEEAPLPAGPASTVRPADGPKDIPSVEPNRANPARSAQVFRVRGVAFNDVLNVRDGPSSDHRATGAIPAYALDVRVVGECVAEWCPIYHRGVGGWVHSYYLVEHAALRGSYRTRRGLGADYR
jgi:hypothetical protein